MLSSQSYRIIYAPMTREHLQSIEKKYYALIRQTIEERLTYEPTVENRNRKPLKRMAFDTATWELRFEPDNRFRIFYEVDVTTAEVQILAIGVKERDILRVGGEEIVL